jgi:hypothetical protein
MAPPGAMVATAPAGRVAVAVFARGVDLGILQLVVKALPSRRKFLVLDYHSKDWISWIDPSRGLGASVYW